MEDGLLSALARLAEEDIRGGPSAEGIAPSAEGIADILWMARLLPSALPQKTPAPVGPPTTASPAPPTGLPSPAAQAHTGPDRPSAVVPPAAPPGDIDLHPIPARPTVPGAGRRPAVTIRIPAVPAIADPMDLAKALRPLKRWVARPRDVVLAEEATATTFGETELIMPVWALARERWLQVDLVVDTSTSMAIWRQTATELRALLERQGAFRNVRAWAIDGDQSTPRLTPLGKTPAGQSVISHSAAELVDPGGRRAVLILTDAVGRSWHDGTMMPHLLTWARSCPLAIIQVLPRRLWHRTTLDIYPVSGVMRPGARPPFQVLDSGSLTAGNLPSGLPAAWVPVLYLDSAWLGPWAAMTAATSEKPAKMFAVPLYEEQATRARQPVPDQDFPADERLRIFREDTASADALELAGYLAAAPLSLPVMRLVQHAMLPRSGPDHLAEVFLSGLLVRVNPADEGGDPDAALYDFREGVREKLLGGLTRRDSLRVLDVLRGVSDTIAKRFGGTLDFRVLASRATAGHDALATESLPFARIAATVLEGLGGSYADLAQALSEAADGGPPEPEIAPAGVHLGPGVPVAMASTARWVEVHRLAVAGREAGIAREVGGRVGAVWLGRSRFADVARLAELTLTLGEDARAFYQLGWAKDATGDRAAALATYDQALRLYRAASDRSSEAATLSNIGAVYRGLGEPQRALEYFGQALPIRREVGDRAGEAVTLDNIGAVYRGLGEPQRALEYFGQALPIRREVGDRAGEAETRYNMAMIHRAGGELDRAVAELEQVVELGRQVGHRDLQSDTEMLHRVREDLASSDPGRGSR
jgi:tetratricopeptide (TPR) repeat protein